MQGELEWSLEQLVKLHEQDWMSYLDQSLVMGDTYDEIHGSGGTKLKTHLGERFFKYKQQVINLKDSVERHFSKVINEIEAGIPSVVGEECKEDDEDDTFNKATTWTCIVCTVVNQM